MEIEVQDVSPAVHVHVVLTILTPMVSDFVSQMFPNCHKDCTRSRRGSEDTGMALIIPGRKLEARFHIQHDVNPMT